MSCIMHTSKHKQAVQHYNLEKNKNQSIFPLIAVVGMSILEAKYYGKFIFMKFGNQNL